MDSFQPLSLILCESTHTLAIYYTRVRYLSQKYETLVQNELFWASKSYLEKYSRSSWAFFIFNKYAA